MKENRSISDNAQNNLSEVNQGDYYKGTVKVLRKAVPGPVIFSLSDGTKIIDGVIKNSKYEVDDILDVEGYISARADKIQLDLNKITKSVVDFDKIIEKISEPKRTTFSIKSNRYEIMKSIFLKIAKRIRKAIFNNQPILIRHHNDSDGINAGIAIEKACEGLILELGMNPKFNIYRSPSKAPFYDISDMFKDIILSNRIEFNHFQKKPLILILDTGSSVENLFAFKTLKSLGYECIVIDHHNPVKIKNNKSLVCKYLSLHLNPYLFGLDSKTSAGMLCYELARFINENFEKSVIPAIAGISDRCDIQETKDYITNSKKSKEELGRMGVAIDFIAYQLRYNSGEGIFKNVYENEEFVNLINEKVTKGVKTQLQSTLPYLRTIEINGITFSYIDLQKYTLRFTYPTPGKVLGLIHDTVAKDKENAVLTIGYVSDMIIIRATKPVFPVSDIITLIKQKLPQANVNGGGHEQAGTIKFVPAHLDVIIELIKEELRKISLKK
jgi:archaea-specific RecJ-like exonuclease